MRLDDLVLAFLERTVEIGGHADVAAQETDIVESFLQLRSEVDQDQLRRGGVGGLLDLREAMGRRGVDAGDNAEIEHQEAAIGIVREQALDVLIKAICSPEE